MPIPPRPHTYCCPACHWSKTVAPRSDVLMPGIDHFDVCPACGHSPLQTQTASPVRASLTELND
ncbi:hypothetical protein F5985_03635 [Malikia spinosa]|uniref:Uncharacterized protein n=1 Tax=Malikia spinosa TaxID=86180 RepID=A0A7C9IWP3_9BURK|nr:hypothetical protein [Malikia spinosa]